MYSKDELMDLMDKATDFDTLQHLPFEWFYRDMQEQYLDSAMDRGRLTVCMKDHNGDPDSPINGRLQGINFQVNVNFRSGKPMTPSIYGDWRIKLAAEDMFEKCPNLYFADFYCYGNNSGHHVTLVMADAGSGWDRFCGKRLPRLDIYNNPFMYVETHGGVWEPMVLSNGVWVEVVVTENLNFLEMAHSIGWVKWSMGHRSIMPRDKDPYCPDCNIGCSSTYACSRCGEYSCY